MTANYAFGSQQITGLNTVKTLTIPAGTMKVRLQADDQDIRMSVDGNNPSSTNGQILRCNTANNNFLEIDVDEARVAKFIEEAVGAVLNVVYIKNNRSL